MSIETWEVPFEAYQGDEPYIFVSYSHSDHRAVFGDLTALHGKGYRLWYDEGIDPGNEWAEEVARALDRCARFVVFISGAAVRSRNVRNEINFALNHDKPFLAIHLEKTELPHGLELRIADIQAILRFRMSESLYFRKLESTLGEPGGPGAGIVAQSAGDGSGSWKGDEEPIDAVQRLEGPHRRGDWSAIRKTGPHVATALIELVSRRTGDLRLISQLVNLGVFLTDADADVPARRCFDVSIEHLLRSVKSSGQSLLVLDQLGMTYNNIARLLRKHNPTSRSAESFYRKSLETFRQLYPGVSDDLDLGDRLGMAYSNLGNALSAQAKKEAALDSYRGAATTYAALSAEDPGNERMKSRLAKANDNVKSMEATVGRRP